MSCCAAVRRKREEQQVGEGDGDGEGEIQRQRRNEEGEETRALPNKIRQTVLVLRMRDAFNPSTNSTSL